MKISTVQPYFSQEFKGIQKIVSREISVSDDKEVQNKTDIYNYYPFADEKEEDVKRNVERLEDEFGITIPNDMGFKTVYKETIYKNKIKVQPALPITEYQYIALKRENLSDDKILEIFA